MSSQRTDAVFLEDILVSLRNARKFIQGMTFTEFSGSMGTGIPSDGHVDKDRWLPIEAESMNHALWEAACSKE